MTRMFRFVFVALGLTAILALGGATALAAVQLPVAVGTWQLTGSMNTPRYFHSAVLLPNGRVLVANGIVSNNPDTSAELYTPAS